MTRILALDLGSRTGWALSDGKGKVYSGMVKFNSGQFEGGGIRYLNFKRWLDKIFNYLDGVDLLYFEAVRRHLGTTASHMYGGFKAVLMAYCEAYKIPYEGIPVGTIKKFITGKGNASKADVIENVKAKGYKPKDDNEADAIALLLCVEELNVSNNK